MSINNEVQPAPPADEAKPVFPSEYEIVMNVLTAYKKQIDNISKQTEDAVEKLRKNLRAAEDASIGLLAQKKLIESLDRDLKNTTGK